MNIPTGKVTIPRRQNRTVSSVIVIVFLAVCATAFGQTQTTVRHYKERVDDTPPEIARAEDAIKKDDFTTAETLLKKALDKDPNNHQAWSTRRGSILDSF